MLLLKYSSLQYISTYQIAQNMSVCVKSYICLLMKLSQLGEKHIGAPVFSSMKQQQQDMFVKEQQ